MGLLDTYGWGFNTKVAYMTTPDHALFKRLREAGAISVFKTAYCAVCDKEVIKGKPYCSKVCMETDEAAKAAAEAEQQEQGEDDV